MQRERWNSLVRSCLISTLCPRSAALVMVLKFPKLPTAGKSCEQVTSQKNPEFIVFLGFRVGGRKMGRAMIF